MRLLKTKSEKHTQTHQQCNHYEILNEYLFSIIFFKLIIRLFERSKKYISHANNVWHE